MLRSIDKVLANKSYRITNQSRIECYEKLEKPILRALKATGRDIQTEFNSLKEQLAATTQVLRYNIEIAEEGHSKAILVFTIVTIIFLPLSFVATLFGMNTKDLRDMENTQVLFWQVSIPLTVGIGGISLLIAYGGTLIRDGFGKNKNRPREKWSAQFARVRRTSHNGFSRRDEEEGDDDELLNVSHGKITPGGRQSAVAHFGLSKRLKGRRRGRRGS
jgi:hypothetical protein